MAYELTFAERFPDAVRRVAREQLEEAAAQLDEGHADDPVEAVHGARKRLKKSRALLRLSRPAMPGSVFRAENRALRDSGRALSGARDAGAMIETVDRLAELYVGRLPAEAFDTLRGQLRERALSARAGIEDALPGHAQTLRALAHRVEEWPLADGDPRTAVRALRDTYARGHKAFARADVDPTSENLHAWRKRVKDLWYQQRLLSAAWPGVVGGQADEAKALSRLLGDDHDLAVLTEMLEGERDGLATVSAAELELADLIAERRGDLLHAARALGRRIYAEKPKRFARRMRRYVRAASSEQPARAVA